MQISKLISRQRLLLETQRCPKLLSQPNAVSFANQSLTEQQKHLMARGLPKQRHLDGVKRIVCVASGKGGVGKSTIAVNLSCALANEFNLKIGLLDADIYGPSIPKMMNLEGHRPDLDEKGLMLPVRNFNVGCMSMGFLVDEKAAMVWRGLMVMQAIERLVFKVNWSPLDILVIDMPPGTLTIYNFEFNQIIYSNNSFNVKLILNVFAVIRQELHMDS